MIYQRNSQDMANRRIRLAELSPMDALSFSARPHMSFKGVAVAAVLVAFLFGLLVVGAR